MHQPTACAGLHCSRVLLHLYIPRAVQSKRRLMCLATVSMDESQLKEEVQCQGSKHDLPSTCVPLLTRLCDNMAV